MKKSKYRHSIVKKHLLVMLTAILTVLMFSFSGKVIKADPSKGKNYFISDYENREEVIDKANELNEEIFGEGVVLLKNEDNALPIEPGAKISLFGKNSLSVLQSGSGSSSGTGNKSINMERALIDAGFELNPALINFYRNNSLSGSGRGSAPANTNMPSGYNTGETPVNMYTAEIENSYDSYDVAVVLFQRIAGEGFDLPRKMSWNGNDYRTWSDKELVPGARSKDDHYLQLDKNESDLLKYLGGHFSKVVVLLNTGSQFETGFLDDPNHYGYHENIKAALWIGYPGGTGLNALADVLKGKVNPSGKTVDTWARDFKKDPTWENFGNNLIDYGNQYTNLVNKTDVRAGYRNNYVYYEEGIYVGYRYYETRGYTDGEEWYHEHVVYPFGYGLSYTSFTQEIVSKDPVENSVLDGDGEITISVKVTNTGTVAGKDVVQLYYTAPYYHQGIEKAHVVLGEFGKTKLLQPEESEIITLTIKVQDMASYDYNDANLNEFKGYELDQGDYEIKLMANSHDVIESVKYRLDETISYQNDGASGNKVENRFDDVSAEINREFSRSDWEGTYPVTQLDITAPQYIIDGSNLWFSGNNPSDEGQPYYNDQMPITGNDSGKIKLEDLYEKDYDDPLWEEFLNQLSVDSLRKLAGQGSYRSGIELNELGIKTVVNADSPAGWVNWSYGTGGSTYTLYSSETILASTWNKKLAYDKGRMIGNEALFGNGGPESRFPGWYAPAVNIHRSQFGGRNFEYYSEDGYLSGAMAAEVVKGAQDKGVFAYVKHFGVNEQEIYRVGLMTWATEQSMREIYLKPFEITVKVGKTRAIMSSLNRIGTIWAGGSYELLTEVLRHEWGFRGMVVTDSFIGGAFSNLDQMIRAGGDLALGSANVSYNVSSPTTVNALRNAAHNILYTHANSMAINSGYSTLPPILSKYEGELLNVGILDANYFADLARVSLNKEILGPDVDDSMIKYHLKEGSTLPTGLILEEDGSLSGIPTQEVNAFKFVVVASYQSYTREATFTISIINIAGSIIFQSEDDPLNGNLFEPFQYSLASAYIYKPDATPKEIENFPKITYSIKNGSSLPSGLKLSEEGIISGIPTKEINDYKFIVLASAMGYKDAEQEFVISLFNTIKFESKTLKEGQFGVYYLDQIKLAESTNIVSYQLDSGSSLPQGLSLTKNGGYIVGVPTEVVTDYSFTIVAIADYAKPIEIEYQISIGITYNETSLPHGEVGSEYETMVNTAQGTRNINYSLQEGSSLPAGLELSNNGVISGTPTEAGTYNFIINASAEDYLGDQNEFTIFIAETDLVTLNVAKTVALAASLTLTTAVVGIGAFLIIRKFKK